MASDLHDDGQDDGARAGLLLDVALEFEAHTLLQNRGVAALVARGGVDRVGDDAAHVAQQSRRVAVAVETQHAARDDLGLTFKIARLLVDGDDRRDDAVVGELATLLNDLSVNLLKARLVDEGAAHLALRDDLRAAGHKLQRVAVLDEDDVRFGEVAVVLQKLLVAVEHPVLAVDWDDELGPHGLGHNPDVFLRSVAGDVYEPPLLVDDGGAAFIDFADEARNRTLVARDDAR